MVYPLRWRHSAYLVGNVSILGDQIKDSENRLYGEIKAMGGDIKDAKKNLKDLTHRQHGLEVHDMAMVEKLHSGNRAKGGTK